MTDFPSPFPSFRPARRFAAVLVATILTLPVQGAFDYPDIVPSSAALAGSALADYRVPGMFLNNPAASGATGWRAAFAYSRLYGIADLPLGTAWIESGRGVWGAALAWERLGGALYAENRVSLSGSRAVAANGVRLGVAVRHHQVQAAGYRAAGATDITLGWGMAVSERLHLAGAVENLLRPALGGDTGALTRHIRSGLSYRAAEPVVFYGTLAQTHGRPGDVALGIRYRCSDLLNLSGGYSTRGDHTGVGMVLSGGGWQVDYAWSWQVELGGTHRVALVWSPGDQ